LQLVSEGASEGDDKPVVFAEIPVFDECSSYIYQLAPTESGGEISVGVAVGVMVPDAEMAGMSSETGEAVK